MMRSPKRLIIKCSSFIAKSTSEEQSFQWKMAHPWCTRRIWIVILLIAFSFTNAFGLKCYKCNSTSTPDCAVNPSKALKYAECPQDDTNCTVAILDDGATYRGCISEIMFDEDCDDCLKSSCTGDLCNIDIYPEDRLRCHKCEKQDCVTVKGEAKPCVNYRKTDVCYTDVIDETDVIRGCSSDDDYSDEIFSELCYGNGCNKDPAVRQFTCFDCDSQTDPNCKHDQSQETDVAFTRKVCSVDVLLGRDELCYTYRNAEKVIRGCARNNADIVMQREYTSTCRTANCNYKRIISPKCFVCDSRVDPNCIYDVPKVHSQACPVETSSCFTCKNKDGSFTRGCGNDTLHEHCLSCWDGDECNFESILSCYECDSVTNKDCARWSANAEDNLKSVLCPEQCIIKTNNDHHTVRGCQTNTLKCESGDPKCKTCDTDICNTGVFPEIRLLCYQCDEIDSACNLLDSMQPTGCAMYFAQDRCYQFSNAKGQMIRGCKSDLRYNECKKQVNGTCLVCDKSGCNNKQHSSPPKLFCVSCDRYDESCAWAQLSSKECTASLPYYREEACITYQYENKTVVRGCIGEVDISCDAADGNCEICQSNGCNNKNMVFQYCVQCSGKDGEGTCAESAEGIAPTQCPKAYQFYDKRGCYVVRTGDNVTRGCINEFDDETVSKCELDDMCKTCLDQSCNTQKAPNSSAAHFGAFPILFLTFLAYSVLFISK